MQRVLEIACFNLSSVILAQKAGADRIELCENYSVGGITPSQELIKIAGVELQTPLHVIIRPRGGNFVYSSNEISQIKESILFCKDQNVKGLVIGCLNANNEIDEKVCEELLRLAHPLPLTFHRAIDQTKNIFESCETLVKLGFKRVLSSGSHTNAYEGKENLGDLQKKIGDQLIIMPGGGIRSNNFKEIIQVSNCFEFHSAALIDGSDICDMNEIEKLKTILLS